MTFWKGLLEIGATGEGDRRSFRRIVLCNQIALAIAAFTLAYNVLYGFYELLLFLPAIILNFFFVAFYGLVLRLNAGGRHRMARRFLLGGGSLQIFLLVWLMGTDCGLQLYLFATPALAALLFSRSEKADLFGLPLFSVTGRMRMRERRSCGWRRSTCVPKSSFSTFSRPRLRRN